MTLRLSRRVALASAAVLLVSAVAAPVASAGGSSLSASCEVGGDSTFTAPRNGWYLWAWRDGTTYLGGGVAYLMKDAVKTVPTPVAADDTTKFGVIGGKTYDYPTCTAADG